MRWSIVIVLGGVLTVGNEFAAAQEGLPPSKPVVVWSTPDVLNDTCGSVSGGEEADHENMEKTGRKTLEVQKNVEGETEATEGREEIVLEATQVDKGSMLCELEEEENVQKRASGIRENKVAEARAIVATLWEKQEEMSDYAAGITTADGLLELKDDALLAWLYIRHLVIRRSYNLITCAELLNLLLYLKDAVLDADSESARIAEELWNELQEFDFIDDQKNFVVLLNRLLCLFGKAWLERHDQQLLCERRVGVLARVRSFIWDDELRSVEKTMGCVLADQDFFCHTAEKWEKGTEVKPGNKRKSEFLIRAAEKLEKDAEAEPDSKIKLELFIRTVEMLLSTAKTELNVEKKAEILKRIRKIIFNKVGKLELKSEVWIRVVKLFIAAAKIESDENGVAELLIGSVCLFLSAANAETNEQNRSKFLDHAVNLFQVFVMSFDNVRSNWDEEFFSFDKVISMIRSIGEEFYRIAEAETDEGRKVRFFSQAARAALEADDRRGEVMLELLQVDKESVLCELEEEENVQKRADNIEENKIAEARAIVAMLWSNQGALHECVEGITTFERLQSTKDNALLVWLYIRNLVHRGYNVVACAELLSLLQYLKDAVLDRDSEDARMAEELLGTLQKIDLIGDQKNFRVFLERLLYLFGKAWLEQHGQQLPHEEQVGILVWVRSFIWNDELKVVEKAIGCALESQIGESSNSDTEELAPEAQSETEDNVFPQLPSDQDSSAPFFYIASK